MRTSPKLAVIVANTIHGDSRVQKTALAAANAGWEVLLIGRSTHDAVERTWLGPVKVVRVPVGTVLATAENTWRQLNLMRPTATTEEATAVRESQRRMRRERIFRQTGLTRSVSKFADRLAVCTDRVRQDRAKPSPDLTQATGDWRHDTPQLLDLDLAFGPVIERFRPDVIHCNDITMLPAAAHAAAALNMAGHPTKWIYDAHEYVAGVDWPNQRLASGYIDAERAFIKSADAVVTVSPEIAELIAHEQKLDAVPLVVRNTPIAQVGEPSGVSVRAAAGLGDATPVLVYSGYLHHERGVGTAVEALPLLPAHHLIIVSGSRTAELRKTLRLAEELGVDDRVHVVPYVPQHRVTEYLSTADLGVICSKRTINYELSLPTKLAEYLHAGLPVVVSDVKTLSAYVREHGVGEVFVSGDHESFAEAVERASVKAGEHRQRITPDIRTELSWEHQVAGLLDLYGELAGRTPAPPSQSPVWSVVEELRGPRKRWRPLGQTPVRLGLGPANFAGQLAEYATAITRQMPEVSAEVFEYRNKNAFKYPADTVITQARMRRLDARLRQTNHILRDYTHLLADAFRPVFGGLNGDSIAADLPALNAAGIRVALLAHGSEIRDPRSHMERIEHSLFRDADEETLASLTEISARNRATAAESDLPLFVTTPDLIADLPKATWAPLVVNPARWASDHPVLEGKRPVVLHAPSKRWTKGTAGILPTLERMHDQGRIELRLIEGVRWREMREMVRSCDVVVDQFAIGAYGVLACEAMAAGRPVVGWLEPATVATIGEEPPILSSPPAQIEEALESLLDDRVSGRERGLAGVDYVSRLHDGRRTVAALRPFLESR